MIIQAQDISSVTAYAAGLLTFFAPCHLPLVPAFLSYIAGVSLQEVKATQEASDGAIKLRRLMVMTSLSYVAGFLVIFMLLGLTASYLGAVLHTYRSIMPTIGGILMILVGAYVAGFLDLGLLGFSKRLAIPQHLTRYAPFNAFILGLAFGFSWTPCVGPVLAVILFWASQSVSFWQGAWLLFLYGVGLGTPFIVLSFFIQRGTSLLRTYRKPLRVMTVASGILMMVIGVMLIGNWVYVLSSGFTKFGSLELYFFDVQ